MIDTGDKGKGKNRNRNEGGMKKSAGNSGETEFSSFPLRVTRHRGNTQCELMCRPEGFGQRASHLPGAGLVFSLSLSLSRSSWICVPVMSWNSGGSALLFLFTSRRSRSSMSRITSARCMFPKSLPFSSNTWMIRSLIFLPMLLKPVSFFFLFFLASWVSSVLKAFARIRWDSLGAEAIKDNCVFCAMYIPIHLLIQWFSVFMVCNVNVFRKRAAILKRREKSSWKFSHLFLWFDIVAHGGCCVRLWELCHLWTWRICAQETYQYHGPSGDRGHTNSWWYVPTTSSC